MSRQPPQHHPSRMRLGPSSQAELPTFPTSGASTSSSGGVGTGHGAIPTLEAALPSSISSQPSPRISGESYSHYYEVSNQAGPPRVHRDRPIRSLYDARVMNPFDSSRFTDAQQVHPDSLQPFPYQWQVNGNHPFTGQFAFIPTPSDIGDHVMDPPGMDANEAMSSSFDPPTFSSSESNDMSWTNFSPGTFDQLRYTQEGQSTIIPPTLPAYADPEYLTISDPGQSEVSANNGAIAMTQLHGHNTLTNRVQAQAHVPPVVTTGIGHPSIPTGSSSEILSPGTATEPPTPAKGGRENKRAVEKRARVKEHSALQILGDGIESTPDTILMGVLEEISSDFKGKNADPTQIRKGLVALRVSGQPEGQTKKSKSHKANLMALAGTLIKTRNVDCLALGEQNQALKGQNQALKGQNQALKEQNQMLEARARALEAHARAVESRLGGSEYAIYRAFDGHEAQY